MIRFANAFLNPGLSAIAMMLWCALALSSGRAEDGRQAHAEIIVQRVQQKCFSRLVHASGYLVPRSAAVVMFNAPGYRIAEVKARVGDMIRKGDVVAVATPLAPPANAPPTRASNRSRRAVL